MSKPNQQPTTQQPTTTTATATGTATTTVRHRLPRRKVNNVWKPLSTKTCDLIQESLAQAIKETEAEEDYASIRRIQDLTTQLTTQIRVPVGVYTGIKLNQEGKVDLTSLQELEKKNSELEHRLAQRTSSTSDTSKKKPKK